MPISSATKITSASATKATMRVARMTRVTRITLLAPCNVALPKMLVQVDGPNWASPFLSSLSSPLSPCENRSPIRSFHLVDLMMCVVS
jgi:hypothetical protein